MLTRRSSEQVAEFGVNVRFSLKVAGGVSRGSRVPGIVIRTLRVTLLSDSGYALAGYEYCARIMWFDDCRFAFEPVSAPRSLTNTQGMQTNC